MFDVLPWSSSFLDVNVMKTHCAILVALVCLQAGCATRVAIPAPNTAAPIAQKQADYERLYRPTALINELDQTDASTGRSYTTITLRALQLASGAEVEHPGDLLPMLSLDDPAAIAANAFARDSRRSMGLGVPSFGLAIASIAMVVYPFAVEGELNTTPIYVGAGLMAAAVGMFIAAFILRRSAERHRQDAFQLYDSGVRSHLGLPPAPPPVLPSQVRSY